MRTLEIVYHGTNSRTARAILRKGFKLGTWFAAHLEDALEYGGPYLFEVMVPRSMVTGWQFQSSRRILPSAIINLTRSHLRRKVLESQPDFHVLSKEDAPTEELAAWTKLRKKT